MSIHILRVAPDLNKEGQENGLPACPICKAKAYLHSNTVDGFWFGWSVGCPRFRLNDGIHGKDYDTPESERLSAHGFYTKEDAKNWWKNRVFRFERISREEAENG